MIDLSEYQTYLVVSFKQFEIYLFDKKNSKIFYSNEIKFENQNDNIDLVKLSKFLDDNIFKIEKLLGKFIKNIFLIIESDQILKVNIGIKKKNYDLNIYKKSLESSVSEVNDLFKENYQENKIMHILVNRFVAGGIECFINQKNLEGEYFFLEIQFHSIPLSITSKIDKILENYHIKINRYLDGKYIRDYFENKNLDFSYMIFKILEGQNVNEINLLEKNTKKQGFFEKFFQLFS